MRNGVGYRGSRWEPKLKGAGAAVGTDPDAFVQAQDPENKYLEHARALLEPIKAAVGPGWPGTVTRYVKNDWNFVEKL